MSDDRKPIWPWVVALLIALPVLYVASFGPAQHVRFRLHDVEWVRESERQAYLPLHKAFIENKLPDWYVSYMVWWVRPEDLLE
jgi:hypothetical protein